MSRALGTIWAVGAGAAFEDDTIPIDDVGVVIGVLLNTEATAADAAEAIAGGSEWSIVVVCRSGVMMVVAD